MKILKLIILALCLFEVIGCLYIGTNLNNVNFIQASFLFIICLIGFIISFLIIENFNKSI